MEVYIWTPSQGEKKRPILLEPAYGLVNGMAAATVGRTVGPVTVSLKVCDRRDSPSGLT